MDRGEPKGLPASDGLLMSGISRKPPPAHRPVVCVGLAFMVTAVPDVTRRCVARRRRLQCVDMVELRPYQLDLLHRIQHALGDCPQARLMMQLPTGGGKTVIAGALLGHWLRDGSKAVWLNRLAGC